MAELDLSKLMDYDNMKVGDLDLYQDIINYVKHCNYHSRYVVKVGDKYIRRKGSSYFAKVDFEKADLYLTEHQAKLSAERHRGTVLKVRVEIELNDQKQIK